MNEKIRTIRKTLDLSMEKFGDRLGVTKATISRIENGGNVTEQMEKSICREFNIDPHWLKTGEGDMFRQISPSDHSISYKERILGALAVIPESEAKYIWDFISFRYAGHSWPEAMEQMKKEN